MEGEWDRTTEGPTLDDDEGFDVGSPLGFIDLESEGEELGWGVGTWLIVGAKLGAAVGVAESVGKEDGVREGCSLTEGLRVGAVCDGQKEQ